MNTDDIINLYNNFKAYATFNALDIEAHFLGGERTKLEQDDGRGKAASYMADDGVQIFVYVSGHVGQVTLKRYDRYLVVQHWFKNDKIRCFIKDPMEYLYSHEPGFPISDLEGAIDGFLK